MQFNDHPLLDSILMMYGTVDTLADHLEEYYKTLKSVSQQEAMIEYVVRYNNTMFIRSTHPSEVVYEAHPRVTYLNEIADYINEQAINKDPFDIGDIVVESVHKMILDELATSRDVFIYLLYDELVLFSDLKVSYTPFTKGKIIETCFPIKDELETFGRILGSTAPIEVAAAFAVTLIEKMQTEDQKVLVLLMLEGNYSGDPLTAIALGLSQTFPSNLSTKDLTQEEISLLRKFQSNLFRLFESGYNGCQLAKTTLFLLDGVEGLLNKIMAISIYFYLHKTLGVFEESEDVEILSKTIHNSDYCSTTLKGDLAILPLKLV